MRRLLLLLSPLLLLRLRLRAEGLTRLWLIALSLGLLAMVRLVVLVAV